MDNILAQIFSSYLASFTPVLIAIIFFEIIWNIVMRAFSRGA